MSRGSLKGGRDRKLPPQMDQPAAVGERIRSERTRVGVSLGRLASIAGLSKAYLVRLENDPKANPSLETLQRIADALDTTVADLLGRPKLRLDVDEIDVPPSLRAFADDAGLSQKELEMLASIRWRGADRPKSAERWKFIYNSLKASRLLDDQI